MEKLCKVLSFVHRSSWSKNQSFSTLVSSVQPHLSLSSSFSLSRRGGHEIYCIEQSLFCTSGQGACCRHAGFIVKLMFNPWRIQSVCCEVWANREQVLCVMQFLNLLFLFFMEKYFWKTLVVEMKRIRSFSSPLSEAISYLITEHGF